MKITDLRVNNVAEPLGFQVTPLSLSWRVAESHDAKRRKWARICIYKDDVCLFDSGEDHNANSLDNPIPGPFGATDPLFISSAYYWQGAARVAEAAKILGYSQDEKAYRELSECIRQAIFETYFDAEGKCICETQTASAMAIMFGLIPPQAGGIQKEADALKKRIDDNNGHLNTGFVGTPNLCPALTKGGYHQTGVNLLLNEDYPGWLYCVNLGATTIWERLNSVEQDGHLNADGMNSLNHYSYGSIEAWMYKIP